MYYFMQTFGCQMNENDSSIIASMLDAIGHQKCTNLEAADIIIINTCCVRESAENRALGFIGSIKNLKQERPDLIIVVCGCMMQKDDSVNLFSKRFPHVDIVVGTFASVHLPKYIEQYAETGQKIIDVKEYYDGDDLPITSQDNLGQHKAQVNINFGCNNFCTYCIVPYVRGRERSRKPQEIIEEIKRLADCGVREVQLLGQNVNSYGQDMPELSWDFARLLQVINSIDGIRRIRYMTSHPRDFDHKLIETIAELDKVCDHYHLPVQSGCDRILELMNRGYTAKEYLQKLEMIREAAPHATITSDIIIGFPSENDADFEQTLSFIKVAQFDAAYTFLYSRRSGTKAAEMDGHISNELKKYRLQILMNIQNHISLAKNRQLIGSALEVMVDGLSKNRDDKQCGRTAGNKIVIFDKDDNIQRGDIVRAQITEAKTWSLRGRILS